MAAPKIEAKKGLAYSLYAEAATLRNANGNSADITLPDDVSELFVGVDITALAGTSPTLTLQIQQQDANAVWQTLAATSALNAVGQTALNLPAGSFVLVGGGKCRVRWVIGGSASPSVTFRAGIHGR